MLKSATFAVGAATCFMMIAPGMVQSSAARSTFERRQEDDAYKALSVNGLTDYRRPTDVTAAAPVSATSGTGQAAEPAAVLPYRQQREY